MAHKSKNKSQKSKSTTEETDSFPHPNLFEHLAQFDLDDPEMKLVTPVHHSPQSTRQKRLDRELELVQLQKEKLALELEVLRLRQNTAPPPSSSATASSSGKDTVRKRVIDWPQEFVPGMSATVEFNALDLPAFVADYLAMIRNYDVDANKHMLAILELLMVKAISYSWNSVRGFYSYLARQVELRRLEWDSIADIREMATTSFKHSDLRTTSSKINHVRPTPAQQSSGSNPGDPPKSCQAWNYKGSCSCDSTADSYASHHTCRVCKSAEHPMLNCPKRKMPIPGSQ